jgi:hypothetical protein
MAGTPRIPAERDDDPEPKGMPTSDRYRTETAHHDETNPPPEPHPDARKNPPAAKPKQT